MGIRYKRCWIFTVSCRITLALLWHLTSIYCTYQQSLWHLTPQTTVTILFLPRCQTKLLWNSSVTCPNTNVLSRWPSNIRRTVLPCWTDIFSISTDPSAYERWGEFSLSTKGANILWPHHTSTKLNESKENCGLCDLRLWERTSPPIAKTIHTQGFDQL